MWKCKDCGVSKAKRSELLKHFKLDHRNFGRRHPYPCVYSDCPCSFKTWSSLKSHVSRRHPQHPPQKDALTTYKCLLCEYKHTSSFKDYFHHIGQHLKNNETVPCVFSGCSYKTNIYGSFRTHKARKHKSFSGEDLKPGIVVSERPVPIFSAEDDIESDEDVSLNEPTSSGVITENTEDLSKAIEHKLASVLLKLEHVFLVPGVAIDDLLQELQYLISTVSVPVVNQTIQQVLQEHNLQVDKVVVDELATFLCQSHPIQTAIREQGPLSTTWKRKAYYKAHFSVVKPVEYVLDRSDGRTFQYVPILQSLQQLLSCQPILDNTLHLKSVYKGDECKYTRFFDSLNFQRNELLSEPAISLILYVDEFEICNPLGTSKKKHKVFGVYWLLGNLHEGCQSSLSAINLAALIKSSDVKRFGYDKVLEPLIDDLVTLERHGLFIEKLGKTVKGTVQCIVADNLGAHSIAGFVENFSGKYVCRFCTAEKEEYQTQEVGSETFCIRTEELHSAHLQFMKDNDLPHHFGVKRGCVFSEKLSHFNVCTGFPADVVHDLFEGIVPFEIALSLTVFSSKKYFTLEHLNKAIQNFPFKWNDKTNRPHTVPLTFSARRTVGGNAHENWSLLRFFPFLIGDRVPANEPAWQLLNDLKDIVDLVVAPSHTKASIAYLAFKISEHRIRFQEVFPETKLLPKHHYLEHYPELIEQFGPLVALWTMRFEAKHSFFKRVVRHTNCFKNVLLSLSQRHQFHMAYHLYQCSSLTPRLEVSHVSNLPIDVLNEDISRTVQQKHPNLDVVCLAKEVTFKGFTYRESMVIAHGECSGLPEFGEIVQIIVLQDKPLFIVRRLDAWYTEHYRAYVLVQSSDKKIELLEHHDLTDPYPLVQYTIGGRRMVALKRYIHV